MQGLEQNGDERDKRVATPPPRKAAGGNTERLNADVNVTPGPQGQQWPEGTGQSLALRARAAGLK